MKIEDQHFQIRYDRNSLTMAFTGSLRMNSLEEFERIRKFMGEAYDLDGGELILDFKSLEFMNSAGISTLCRFIYDIKEGGGAKALTVLGNEEVLWQKKSFENLKKIWSGLNIRFASSAT